MLSVAEFYLELVQSALARDEKEHNHPDEPDIIDFEELGRKIGRRRTASEINAYLQRYNDQLIIFPNHGFFFVQGIVDGFLVGGGNLKAIIGEVPTTFQPYIRRRFDPDSQPH
jgi:hypothetical protein